MHDERPREGVLILGIGQHLQEEAHQLLGELVLDHPEHQLLQQVAVLQLGRQGGVVWWKRERKKRRDGVTYLIDIYLIFICVR